MKTLNLKISSLIALALLVSAGPALALYIPQVQTNSATNIQDVSATLGGNLYDLGGDSSATVWFQYGTSANYGYGTNTSSQNYAGYFTQNVYGLSPNTTYHYRAVVQNGYAANYGQDMTFTTSNSGYNSNFYTQTNAATSIYNNQATLNGYVYGGTYNTLVWFQYGTSTNYGYTTNSQQLNYSGATSQSIANLLTNTTYHYRIVAQNSNGQVAYGQDMTFYTGGATVYQPNQAAILEGIRQMIVLLQQILSQMRYSSY